MRLTWRPLTRADIPAWTKLLVACEAVDRTGENYSQDDLAEELDDRSIDLARDSHGAQTPDGELVAAGLVSGPTTAGEFHRVSMWGGVHPARRGQGLGRALLAWQVRRGAELHRERFPDVPGLLVATCLDTAPDRVRLFTAAGLRAHRVFNAMVRPLSDPLPAGALPEGCTLAAFDPERDEEVRRAHNAAFAQHWGSSDTTEQAWQARVGSRVFRRELSFLVLGPDGSVVSYLLAYFWESDAAATGVREAFVGSLGTLREWRGRGLATAALGACARAAREQGYDTIGLNVDTDNVTGALGLYERLGFTLERRWVSYARELPVAGDSRLVSALPRPDARRMGNDGDAG